MKIRNVDSTQSFSILLAACFGAGTLACSNGATGDATTQAVESSQQELRDSREERVEPTLTRELDPDTCLYTPPPRTAAIKQVRGLVRSGHFVDAARVAVMEGIPRAVWLVGNAPDDTRSQVRDAVRAAEAVHEVPVFVAYNLPGRDCGGYSAGGAQTAADYALWIDAVAMGLGRHKAVLILEPDGVALSPDQCGNVSGEEKPALQAERNAELNAAIERLELQPQTSVYLDAGHSHWHGVGAISQRLVAAGLHKAQGFFLNASNYQPTPQLTQYGTWIAKCIHYSENAAEGGWRLGHYDYCASQYYPATVDDYSTYALTDQWYAENVDNAANPPADPSALAHFVIDTSRNGQGNWHPTATYPDPQDWCNPPARGLGLRPTLDTGNPLVQAFLWIKAPGESDGSCNRGIAGGTTDPEWADSLDPAAGIYFPEQALQLAQLATPPLF